MKRILCVAGEVSGDRLMAPVVRALVDQGHSVTGVGGDLSIGAGLAPVAHIQDYCVGGVTEVMSTIPRTYRLLRTLKQAAAHADAVLLVDWPEINMRLLRALGERQAAVAYLSPPQAWAWRGHRAKTVAKAGFIGCLFKFEADWYQARDCDVTLLRHPLADLKASAIPEGAGIALLPGSRVPYVRRLLPIQLRAYKVLQQKRPTLRAYLGCAPTVDPAWAQSVAQREGVQLTVYGDADQALRSSKIALVGVGTAALHTALAGRPYVAMAQVSTLTSMIVRQLIETPRFTLPNLILGEGVFPELIQSSCTVDNVVAATEGLLASPEAYVDPLNRVREGLHEGAAFDPLIKFLGSP